MFENVSKSSIQIGKLKINILIQSKCMSYFASYHGSGIIKKPLDNKV